MALPGLVSVRLLRAEEDFLSPPPAGQVTVRDVQGVLQRVLDSERATAVLQRPDRYVFAYLYGTATDAENLHRLLQAHGMDSHSLRA